MNVLNLTPQGLRDASTLDGATVFECPADYAAKMDNDPNLIHFACIHGNGLGAQLFARRLQVEHFRPYTRASDQFSIIVFDLVETHITVYSVPASFLEIARGVAASVGWQALQGSPVIQYPVSVSGFTFLSCKRIPFRGPRVYTLFPSADSIIHAGPEGKAQADAIATNQLREIDAMMLAWRGRQDEIYHRGRTWKRHKGLPVVACDIAEIAGGTFYTSEPPREDWNLYPK